MGTCEAAPIQVVIFFAALGLGSIGLGIYSLRNTKDGIIGAVTHRFSEFEEIPILRWRAILRLWALRGATFVVGSAVLFFAFLLATRRGC